MPNAKRDYRPLLTGEYGRCAVKNCQGPCQGYLTVRYQDRRGRWKQQSVARCHAHGRKAADGGR